MKAMIAGALALALPAAAAAADLSGPWAVKGEFGPQFKYTLICALGPAGSGPCSAIQGKVLRTTGRLSGDVLKFDYDTDFNGSGVHLEYYGKVREDGVVRGAVKTTASQGVFEASRLTPAGAEGPQAWRISVGFSEQMKYVVICAFKADGAKLAGPCGVAIGPMLQARGEGGAFAYDTSFQGRPTHVVYTGEAQPDGSLKGVIRSNDALGAFTAARQ